MRARWIWSWVHEDPAAREADVEGRHLVGERRRARRRCGQILVAVPGTGRTQSFTMRPSPSGTVLVLTDVSTGAETLPVIAEDRDPLRRSAGDHRATLEISSTPHTSTKPSACAARRAGSRLAIAWDLACCAAAWRPRPPLTHLILAAIRHQTPFQRTEPGVAKRTVIIHRGRSAERDRGVRS